MIGQWLAEGAPDESTVGRRVIPVQELEPPTEDVHDYLTRRLVEQRLSLRVAKDMARILGWDAVEARLQPGTVQVRHGDFGEMLAGELLSEFQGLLLPINKLRYQMHADQTLVGADLVGLELSDERAVRSMHFGEAKLRTTRDLNAGKEAHAQLERWLDEEFADILLFFGSRLQELHPELYEPYIEYLADTAGDRDDTYHIVLICDSSKWSAELLNRIPAPPDQLDPLLVRYALVEELALLVSTLLDQLADALDSA